MDKSYKGLDAETNLYNEKNLFLLNIKELRDMGRKLGVPSPTTMKKEALVGYILKIIYGEVATEVRNPSGRPNVREFDINHYVEKIKRKSNITPDDVNSVFRVAEHIEKELTNEVQQRIFVEDGEKFYLRQYGFVESEGDKETTKEIKEKFGLENFDVVEVIISGKSFKIVSINGKIVNDTNDFENEYLGKKQVFHYCTKEEINDDILRLLNEGKNLKKIVFSREDYSAVSDEYIKTEVDADLSKAYKQFMMFVGTCEKYVYDGENVLVVTDEAEFIEQTIERLDMEVSNRTKKHLQSKIEELLSLGNALVVYKLDKDFIYQ